jgi:hypothetical protein
MFRHGQAIAGQWRSGFEGSLVTIYTIDPLKDQRWTEFVDRHELATVFHSAPWLEAIKRTYDYSPVVYTTSPPSTRLSNGVVLCRVHSWLTGRRMVSVPFSDHCDPLLDGSDATVEIFEALRKKLSSEKLDYIELRPRDDRSAIIGAQKMPPFYLHVVDLKPSSQELFRNFHKDCIQRKIRRAEREALVYESGNSERLLSAFYRLMIQTRRKHQLPPQPIQWFRNLAACMGDRLQIRVAFKDGKEIASILTVKHKDTIVYKYGCSDAESQNLGATPLLFWKTIEEAKAEGLQTLDLGRSDTDNPGLIAFKDRLGAKSSILSYVRWSRKRQSESQSQTQNSHAFVKRLFAIMPDAVLQAAGRILYRHVA